MLYNVFLENTWVGQVYADPWDGLKVTEPQGYIVLHTVPIDQFTHQAFTFEGGLQ